MWKYIVMILIASFAISSSCGVALARCPGGCSSEQCCHEQMQQCYDNGGGGECSDRYDSCVKCIE